MKNTYFFMYPFRYLLEKEESRAPVLPQSLVDFLELSLYDLDYILGGLSSSKDSSTTSPETKELWNPLTLHAITRRLSTHDIENEHYPSLYKYCADLPNLGVKGSEDPFGSSDILPNTLQFNFKAFQSLKCLRLERIRFEAIESLESLKDSLEELSLNHCPSLTSIQASCDQRMKEVVVVGES
ncbi:Uncharacterized protein FKW44_024348 [Caligus rogercresseyi]|uniref:Uncharacterized protein n=1 Tax=Caligus rogercresseyi TaxID=217165 RepID=A0A7T8JUE6_CALRO|nr:Uncharacterized protein FKW44_024792 [Caligus rogercresseyi]QQP33097.1 Uncharacterized protein FKW44_024348 [Caligus rogercresseyi]